MTPPDANGPEGSLNLLSIISALFALITLKELQVYMTLLATGVAIVSGCMAIYLYYLKIKAKNFKDQ